MSKQYLVIVFTNNNIRIQHYESKHNAEELDEINIDGTNELNTLNSESDLDSFNESTSFDDRNQSMSVEIVSHATDFIDINDKAQIHIKIDGQKDICCKCCPNETYTCVGHLSQHIFATQNIDMNPCDKCNGLFLSQNQLLIHQNMHESKNEYECPHCTTAFSDLTKLMLI